MRQHKKLIVYAGASIKPLSLRIKSLVDLRPPIKHGDLYRLIENKDHGTVLMVDGWFGSIDAITLTECRDYLFSGRTLVGCSSMGALRAADLWNAGMIGIGEIYTAYRTGLLRSDADVAVSLNPETFDEITVSLAFVRAAATRAARTCPTPYKIIRKTLSLASSIHFTDRTTKRLLKLVAKESDFPVDFVEQIGSILMNNRENPKVIDCKNAIINLRSRFWPLQEEFTEYEDEKQNHLMEIAKSCEACSFTLSSDDIFCPQCCSVSHEQ